MTLRFIIGRAGSGKSHTCMEEISSKVVEDPQGKPLILLVPEQATFQMEYALATTRGMKGLLRVQVMSFRRLAYRVLLETGGGARTTVGELGKRMVLRRLLGEKREQLKVFGRSAGQFGFTDSLARSISELKTYRITPTLLDQAKTGVGVQEKLLQDKLEDLHLLYEGLEEFLQDRFTDPDDYLNLLAAKAGESVLLKGAELWVDGFNGFTPQEFAVLEQLLSCTDRMNITLTMDGLKREPRAEYDLFFPQWETMLHIGKLAAKKGVAEQPPLVLSADPPYRFRNNAVLAALESNYFQYPSIKWTGDSKGLTLVAGANRRAEVEAAAREIIRLCREEGLKWREIAVLQRSLTDYHQLIATIFADYNIPCFIDQSRDVLQHPLVELIRSVLEIVGTNWSYQAVFRYLKTDLAPLSRDKVDALENYVLAHGLTGHRWLDGQAWNYRRRYSLGEDQEISASENSQLLLINRARLRVVTSLQNFAKEIGAGKTARAYTGAIYRLLEELHVPRKLEKWSSQEEARGAVQQAREHLQIWNSVLALFDELVEALGEEEISLEDYQAVLGTGLESLRLATIPPGLDQVLVGSLDRTRNPDYIRAVLLLGASEGILPARPQEDGLLNDRERELLAGLGLNLAPGGRRQAFEEQFFLYSALTRAGERLWISYPLADEEGKTIPPSQVVHRLRELVPGLEEKFCQVGPVGLAGSGSGSESGCRSESEGGNRQGEPDADLEYVVSPDRVLDYLGAGLRGLREGKFLSPMWQEAYQWLLASPNYSKKTQQLLKVLSQANGEKPLSTALGRKLYGEKLRGGVSRLEKFNNCPFAHFANYGLRLEERQIFRLAAPDMGNFFHAALENFALDLNRQGVDWGQLSGEQIREVTTKVVDLLVPQLQSEILLSTNRLRYLTGKLTKTVERAAQVLAQHAARSVFRPVGLEVAFGGGKEGALPPITIDLPGGTLELTGRIDRVDAAATENGTYLRIIDYKSGYQKLGLPEVYIGLKLQLLTYLAVALAYGQQLTELQGEVIPGGVFYFTVRDPSFSLKGPQSPEQVEMARLKALKMQGLLLADTRVFEMMDSSKGQAAPLFSVKINKDGSFSAWSQVATPSQFEALQQHVKTQLIQAGSGILQGEIELTPYKFKTGSSCSFCPYRPVCRFDLGLPENKFRSMPGLSNGEIWSRLEGGE